MSAAARWWGAHEIAEGGALAVAIGPLSLWVERRARELVVHQRYDLARLLDRRAEVVPADAAEIPEGLPTRRFAMREAPGVLHFAPMLADRPVVVGPETPLSIPAGEQATLFVTTPAWLSVALDAEAAPLVELPIVEPSKTWFGPSSTEGELCYASRTSARLDGDALPRRPSRVFTAVTVENGGADPLPIERLKLPARVLAVFGDAEGLLWSQSLTFAREEDGAMGRVVVSEASPATGAERLAEPRDPSRGLLRAVSDLLH